MSDFVPLPSSGNGGRNGAGRGRGGRRQNSNHNWGRGGVMRRQGRGGGGRNGRGSSRGWGGRGRNHGRVGANFHHSSQDMDIEELGDPSPNAVSIAIEGCCHGELDRIYESLSNHEKKTGRKVDLLICCGDFQSFRNPADFHSASIPPKYRRLGTFPQYFAGEKKAPVLTLFIGGNHEASQPLRELYYGGWAAPNIYYLGAAGVVRFGGLRIGGISGIYKKHDYRQGHFERPPYDNSSLRSVYHIRNVDVYRMKSLTRSRLDVMVSHDWPLGIERHGDTKDLLRRKPFFRDEIDRNDLGSPPNREILDRIRPHWWFAAHLHVKFKASLRHGQAQPERKNEDATLALVPSQVRKPTAQRGERVIKEDVAAAKEGVSRTIQSDNSDATAGSRDAVKTEFHALEGSASCGGSDLTDQMTQFLALDKCLPRRSYLSILHLPAGASKGIPRLEYDLEWLAILRKTHELNTAEHRHVQLPTDFLEVSDSDIGWVRERLNARNPRDEAVIPVSAFRPTVPFYNDPKFCSSHIADEIPLMGNPQTDELLGILDLNHIVTVPYTESQTVASADPLPSMHEFEDDNEIDIASDSETESPVIVAKLFDDGIQTLKKAKDAEFDVGNNGSLIESNTEADPSEDVQPFAITPTLGTKPKTIGPEKQISNNATGGGQHGSAEEVVCKKVRLQ